MASHSYPVSMTAVQVVEFKAPYQIKTVPVPTLQPHDLLVKVAVASYCHTDSMVRNGLMPGVNPPITASHEGSGTVVAVGPAVVDSFFKVGDRVMCGLPLEPCGSCQECTGPEKFQHYCHLTKGGVGVTADGNFADYVRIDSRFANRLPDDISFATAAPLACAGRTIWRAIDQAGLQEGQWLGIMGAGGGLGHIGIQFAKNKGLKVVGVDARDEGLALARELGADLVIDARGENQAIALFVREATGGGVDATIALADAPGATALSAAITKMHGTVVQVGQPDEVRIPFYEFVFRDIRFKGSMLASVNESYEMLEHVAKYGVRVEMRLFDGLESIEELLGVVKSGSLRGKAVVIVDREQVEKEKRGDSVRAEQLAV
ncbi:alcohol dehydrogenase [Thozetella sp. PMI_491]|nr:alcohol dehydrogenase [Thozetella sp. PMI_491]